jgi:hypothetical protein
MSGRCPELEKVEYSKAGKEEGKSPYSASEI